MGDETHLAKWALGTITLGAVLGPVSSVCAPPLCPRLRSIDPEVMPLSPKCQKSLSPLTAPFCRPCTPRPERPSGLLWVAQPGGGTWEAGPRLRHLPHSGTAPQMPKEGWRVVGGPGARRQRLGRGAAGPSRDHPLPPTARTPAWLRAPDGPAAGTSAQAQTSIHTRALARSFFSALLFPPQLTSFFFSPLSLPTCHYSRNKKCGNNAGIDGGPLPAPSPRGACQHSFHPPRAGTAAKGALLINKRNQINQEHNRGICCT